MAVPRVTVVHDDPELVDMLGNVFPPSSQVRTVAATESMTLIADHKPDLLVVGPLCRDDGSLTSWDVVALARAHRALRQTPIILLSADLDGLMADGRQIAKFAGVHVIGMPFDLDVLCDVIRSVQRDAAPGDVLVA